MNKVILTSALVLTGCINQRPDFKPLAPEPLIRERLASQKEWDGSKGQFPPGRVIDYKGHGGDYTNDNGHINHHRHHGHGHGGLGYHND